MHQPPEARTKRAHRIDELANEGPIKRSGLYEAIRDGRLIARKFGRITFVLEEDYAAFLKSLPALTLRQPLPKPSSFVVDVKRAARTRLEAGFRRQASLPKELQGPSALGAGTVGKSVGAPQKSRALPSGPRHEFSAGKAPALHVSADSPEGAPPILDPAS